MIRQERFVRGAASLCLWATVLTTLALAWTLIGGSLPFFRVVPLADFLFGTEWRPAAEEPSVGVLPLLLGTLLVTVGAGLFALPLGLFGAIYLREYASHQARRVFRPALGIMAGIPSVVYGALGLFFVTPLLRQILPGTQATNALAGMIVVGLMVLPLVCALSEEAIAAVPAGLRESAYGLGSTRCEATLKVVLPSAWRGILAAFVLALTRAVGETMAVALAAGAVPNLTVDPRRSVQTMSAAIVSASETDAATGSLAYTSLFAVALLLFALTFAMSALASRLVRRWT